MDIDFNKKIARICTATAIFTLAVLAGVWYAYQSLLSPVTLPADADVHVRVEQGMTGAEIGMLLEGQGIIRSADVFRVLLSVLYPDVHIQAGTYIFASDVASDIFGVIAHMRVVPHTVRLVFPEGLRGKDIKAIIAENMSHVAPASMNASDFDAHIGYLFPDTYSVDETETADDIIARMRARYDEVIAEYRAEIDASGFTEREIITLASLIQREANDAESMAHVSGILRNRLASGMRLQIDATLHYIFNKTSAELTKDDLASDSPYNTYRYEGLPPGPIANPGHMAIEAVLRPAKTRDLFYLTGSDGVFYYSETFEEHKRKKAMYLR